VDQVANMRTYSPFRMALYFESAWRLTMATPPPHATQPRASHWPPRGPARVLVVLDRPVLIELIKMTLNHGVYSTRQAATVTEVATALTEWRPHLAILDMDLDGPQIMQLLAASPVGGMRLPVIGLTRRGDLKTKLNAFDAGVDDILTVPFAPEEMLGESSRSCDAPIATL